MVQSPRNPENARERRKRKTPWWEKAAVLVALGLLVVNFFQMRSTDKAARAAKDSADWTATQTKYIFSNQQPWVWVKMPDSFHVEVGKPISAAVEVFNYGNALALVRAHIYIEASPGIIERLRDHPLKEKIPDAKGVREIALDGRQGTKEFIVEQPQRIVTEEDYRMIENGRIDVVAYGRIDFDGLIDPLLQQYNSIFCFYRLRDGSVSACPNYEHGYTNWME